MTDADFGKKKIFLLINEQIEENNLLSALIKAAAEGTQLDITFFCLGRRFNFEQKLSPIFLNPRLSSLDHAGNMSCISEL